MSRILGLDLGTKFGWSVFNMDGTHVASGVKDFTKFKDKGVKWSEVCKFLNFLMEEYNPAVTAYEEAKRHLGIYAAHSFGAMQGMLYLVHNHCFYDFQDKPKIIKYSPTEIKKFATGKGNSGKQYMLEVAIDRWPELGIIDDNHADALWIGFMTAINEQFRGIHESRK